MFCNISKPCFFFFVCKTRFGRAAGQDLATKGGRGGRSRKGGGGLGEQKRKKRPKAFEV